MRDPSKLITVKPNKILHEKQHPVQRDGVQRTDIYVLSTYNKSFEYHSQTIKDRETGWETEMERLSEKTVDLGN